MKTIIDGKRYDTATATAICSGSSNGFVTDLYWWEGTLYRTKGGAYFVAGRGNAGSMFAQPGYDDSRVGGEGIIPYTVREAMEFAADHGGPEVVEAHFGELVEDARGPGRPAVGPATTLRLPVEMTERLDAIAERDSVSRAEVVRRMVAERMATATGLEFPHVWSEPNKTVLTFTLRESSSRGELTGEVKLTITELSAPELPPMVQATVQRDGHNAESGEFATTTAAIAWGKSLDL